MGLIGGMARTAVVAGTATAVSNRVSRRQANRWAAQDEQAYQQQQQVYAQPAPSYEQVPPAPAASEEGDMFARLEKLGRLHDSGVLDDEEFKAAKAKLLNEA